MIVDVDAADIEPAFSSRAVMEYSKSQS